MGIERARVLEVAAGASVRAGYLLDDRLVLTAGADKVPAQVRPAGTATWLTASPVWSSPAGVTVLELDDPAALWMAPTPPPFGRVSGSRPVAVMAMGFPTADAPTRWARDPEQFLGHVAPAAARALQVTGSRPAGGGMTGAALFAGAELVAVLVDGGRAVPVSALADEPGFAAVVGGGGGLVFVEVSASAAALRFF